MITKEFEGWRLDVFLTEKQAVKTRSQASKLIAENQALLNNSKAKASYRLKSGDCLKVQLLQTKEETLSPYIFPLEIPYEDKDILIVNKPAGLVVHPAPGHKEKTLVNILFHKTKLSPGSHPLRPGLIHRLDKDVSGLLVLAKTTNSYKHLIKQFKNHCVKREYWAVCLRSPSPLKNTVESWIARHPVHRKKFISLQKRQPGSKKASTSYELIRRHKSGLSWIKCHLKTGRTHQIRVHLSSLSCPLVGDGLYGGKNKISFIKDPILKEQIKKLNRIVLHARHLSFTHPSSGKQLTFHSPWPAELKDFLKNLDFYKK